MTVTIQHNAPEEANHEIGWVWTDAPNAEGFLGRFDHVGERYNVGDTLMSSILELSARRFPVAQGTDSTNTPRQSHGFWLHRVRVSQAVRLDEFTVFGRQRHHESAVDAAAALRAWAPWCVQDASVLLGIGARDDADARPIELMQRKVQAAVEHANTLATRTVADNDPAECTAGATADAFAFQALLAAPEWQTAPATTKQRIFAMVKPLSDEERACALTWWGVMQAERERVRRRQREKFFDILLAR